MLKNKAWPARFSWFDWDAVQDSRTKLEREGVKNPPVLYDGKTDIPWPYYPTWRNFGSSVFEIYVLLSFRVIWKKNPIILERSCLTLFWTIHDCLSPCFDCLIDLYPLRLRFPLGGQFRFSKTGEILFHLSSWSPLIHVKSNWMKKQKTATQMNKIVLILPQFPKKESLRPPLTLRC